MMINRTAQWTLLLIHLRTLFKEDYFSQWQELNLELLTHTLFSTWPNHMEMRPHLPDSWL